MNLEQAQADIAFLLERSGKAGSCSFHDGRDTGVSSNSIVAIAYGYLTLEKQELPSDHSDLSACEITWRKLPSHRRTSDAKTALDRARAEVERRYPQPKP